MSENLERAIENLTDEERLIELCNMDLLNRDLKEIALRNPNLRDETVLKKFNAFENPNFCDDSYLIDYYLNADKKSSLELLFEKIKNPYFLNIVALYDDDPDLRKACIYNPNLDENTLNHMAMNDEDIDVRELACEKVTDEDVLIRIASSHDHPCVRSDAVDKIRDKKTLEKIILYDESNYVQKIALDTYIRYNSLDTPDDLEVLRNAALCNTCWAGSTSAIHRIDDEAMLIDIAKNAYCSEARWNAKRKLEPEIAESLDDVDEKQCCDYVKRTDDEMELSRFILENNSIPSYVAEAALEKIDDEDILFDIAKRSKDTFASYALERIENNSLLYKLFKMNRFDTKSHEILEKIDDKKYLIDIAFNDSRRSVRQEAAERIHNMDVLIKLALTDRDAYDVAINNIDDEDALFFIAKVTKYAPAFKVACSKISNPNYLKYLARWGCAKIFVPLKRIDDEEYLIDLALNSDDADIRFCAVGGIEDPEVLADIASKDSHPHVRSWAIRKLFGEDAAGRQDLLMDMILNESDSSVAKDAIEILIKGRNNEEKEKLLFEIVNDAENFDVSYTALKFMRNHDYLKEIALNTNNDGEIRAKAIDMVYDPVGRDRNRDVFLKDDDWRIRYAMINMATGEKTLMGIVNDDADDRVRAKALRHIDTQEFLYDFALSEDNLALVFDAINTMRNTDLLRKICEARDDNLIKACACDRIAFLEADVAVLGLW